MVYDDADACVQRRVQRVPGRRWVSEIGAESSSACRGFESLLRHRLPEPRDCGVLGFLEPYSGHRRALRGRTATNRSRTCTCVELACVQRGLEAAPRRDAEAGPWLTRPESES